jgi:predicted metal-dependent hydrolase
VASDLARLIGQGSSRVSEVAHFDVSHAGETYRVKLKRSAAARRFILRFRDATQDLVLTIPARAKLIDAKGFAETQAPWIGSRLRRSPQTLHLEPGALLPLRGVPHRIDHRPAERGVVWIQSVEDSFGSSAEPLLCVNSEACFVARRIHDFLVRQARRDLEAAVARHAAHLGVRVRKITLRDTTSRWGSCTSSGELNFSWRLIMAPPFVLDYLAAHEVAHLRHMNHSPAFWKTLGSLSKEVAAAESWLRTHGMGLHRIGPKTNEPAGVAACPKAANHYGER